MREYTSQGEHVTTRKGISLRIEPQGSRLKTRQQNANSIVVISSFQIAVNDRPDAPRTPVVENVKDTSAYIRWAAPNDNGGFITHYVVEKFETANPEAGWVKAGTTRFPYINLQSEQCFVFIIIRIKYWPIIDSLSKGQACILDNVKNLRLHETCAFSFQSL